MFSVDIIIVQEGQFGRRLRHDARRPKQATKQATRQATGKAA
jgi:hypothetical protein